MLTDVLLQRTEPVRGGDVPGVAEALSTLGRDLGKARTIHKEDILT